MKITTASTEIKAALEKSTSYLVACAQSGWSYSKSDQKKSIETTAWCALGLLQDKQMRQQAAKFIISCQNPDGGWSTEFGAGDSDWTSALAILALKKITAFKDDLSLNKLLQKSIDKGSSFLKISKTKMALGFVMRSVLILLRGPKYVEQYGGWPWNTGCYFWVEPTSYAVLALEEQIDAKDMVEAACKWLLSRACQGGGWNHGAYKTLNVYLPPYLVTTAQALTALQKFKNEESVVAGLKYLDSAINDQNTVMALSWAIMAKNIYNQNVDELVSRLLALQNSDGSFGSTVYLTALATCALNSQTTQNPLRFLN